MAKNDKKIKRIPVLLKLPETILQKLRVGSKVDHNGRHLTFAVDILDKGTAHIQIPEKGDKK